MTSFTLKIIGIVSMICDHFTKVFIKRFNILNLIGRLAFPIFAYQSVQAYINTKNIKKHLIKLLVWALISQIPFQLFVSTITDGFYLNVLFTFFLGLLALYIYDKINNKYIGFIIVIIISIISELIKVDYGAFGIILIFNFYYFVRIYKKKNRKLIMAISTFLLCNFKYVGDMINYPYLVNPYFMLGIATSLAIIPIMLHNKQEGPKLKYFFYIIYPLHMIIFYLIYNLIH